MIKAESAGSRTLQIINENGEVIFEKMYDLIVGEQELTINAEIPLGSNYVLSSFGDVENLWLLNEGTFPYELGGLVKIKGSTLGSYDLYPYYFNWKIKEKSCVSDVSSLTVGVIQVDDQIPYKFYVDNSTGTFMYKVDFFFNQETTVKFGVYGISGQLVTEYEMKYDKGKTEEDLNVILDLKSNSGGVFFITINGGEIEQTEKIVIKGGSN